MSRKKVLVLTLFVLVMGIRGWTLFGVDTEMPKAVDGVLDLRNWNLAEDGTIHLAGQWRFVPSDFADPRSAAGGTALETPGPWDEALGGGSTFGYGTYQLRILLSDADRERPYVGIRSSNVRSAHRLYMNGEQLGGSGTPGRDRASTSPQNTPYVVEAPVRGGELMVTVHVANFDYGRHGGIFDNFRLGTLNDIVRAEQAEKMMEYAMGSVFTTLGLLMIIMFFLRRQNPELLWFGAFFLSYVAFSATHGEKQLFLWLPWLSYEWQSKIQLFSSLSVYVSMMYFVRYMFPRYYVRWAIAAATIVSAALALVCLLGDVAFYSSWEAIIFIFEGILSVYIMAWILAGVLTAKEESVFALVGSLCLFYEQLFIGLTFIGYKTSNFFFPVEMLTFVVSMGVLISMRFFDNLKKVEEASRKIVLADRMKSEFLTNTSHELRTPLHGMINMAQVTLDEGGLDLAKEERLRLIVSTGRHLSHLLEDILDLSRLNEGTIQINPSPVDLHTTVDGARELLPYVTDKASANIENRIDPEMPKAFADSQRVMQIVFNLLHNAVKHSGASTIFVEASVAGALLRVSVIDDGKGIPQEFLPDIFTEFQQAQREGEPPPKGAGLGLAITRKLVELQGGTIMAASEPGVRTEFRFTLPIAPAESAAEAAAGTERTVPAGTEWARGPGPAEVPVTMERAYRHEFENAPRILLVEDDPVSLKVVYEMLTSEKYSVDAVSDGRTAMRGLTGVPRWDAVILDVSLPGKTGYDLCRTIRQRFTYHELPVLFLTARSQPADLLAGFDAGANDYVLKPVDSTELKARVRTLLQMKLSVRERLHMEMALIQAQIKPHFLFNALNTIASLSETDPDRMREVLTDFGLYLKHSFDLRNLNDVVPFPMEWSLVQSYLSVERARFGDRIRIVERVPEDAAFELPPLSIQPIVENALRHGILKRAEGGEVTIAVEPVGSRVAIAVSDTGVGFPEGVAERILEGRHEGGIGLTNIHRRLVHVYGKGLSIESVPGGGTTIRFEVSNKVRTGE